MGRASVMGQAYRSRAGGGKGPLDTCACPRQCPALMAPDTETLAERIVAGDRRADLVLKELQGSKMHLAIVLDDYGGTAGVMTLEDLVEEIVGDIQDEYDTGEEVEFIRQTDGEYSIDGSMDLHDVNELLKVDLPTDSSDTLGGFIYNLLGRVPQLGEVLPVTDHGLTLRIDSLDGLRIRKVQVSRADESLAAAAGTTGGDT